MSDKLEIRVIEKIDFEDIEECIAKDYRHYVKLKSREEPYEVTKDTYERVLTWIAEVNAKRERPKSCPFCGGEASVHSDIPRLQGFGYGVGCSNPDCIAYSGYGMAVFEAREDAVCAWNRRAE